MGRWVNGGDQVLEAREGHLTRANRPKRRQSMRLNEYDYSQVGAYYVTMSVRGQFSLMGALKNGQVNLSPIGSIVNTCWRHITNRYALVELDAFVVMPNHLHGILFIHNVRRGEAFGLSSAQVASVKPMHSNHPNSASMMDASPYEYREERNQGPLELSSRISNRFRQEKSIS